MFNPQLLAAFRRVLPAFLLNRLDPFEAAISAFVQSIAATTPPRALVLDAGAGSGRAGVGVLLARPKAIVTGLDVYSGYWGIEGFTGGQYPSFYIGIEVSGSAIVSGSNLLL